MVSTRLARMQESATIKAANRASEMLKQGIDVINFNLGEPDFDTPKHICDAAADAMYRGETHYSPAAGIPELREAIAKKLRSENGLETKASNVLVTPGAKQAIFSAMMSVLGDGEEAILFDPAWVSYEACVHFAGAEPVWVPTDPDNGFEPCDIGEYITDKTKMVVVNSPCNPTGGVYGKKTLRSIADHAIDHDLIVLSDEIYEKIIYEKEHVSIGSLDGMQDRTITINGFSKAYAMTGWRIGYASAASDIFNDLLKIQSNSVSCATTFVQFGGVAALEGTQKPVHDMVKEFHVRTDILVNGLNSIGLRCHKPDGAFYVFADVSEFGDGDQITDQLLNEAHVSVTQGSSFGHSGNDFIRLSYATSQQRIYEGLERIGSILG